MERSYWKFLQFLLVSGFCGSVFGALPEPDSAEFKGIHGRNVFGLKEAEQQPVLTVPRQPPGLILEGITTILGNKRAVVRQLPKPEPGRAATPGQGVSVMLTEGQSEGEVEVLEINEKAGEVRVKNAGAIVTLSFEKDGVKPPSSSPPGPGGIPNINGVPVPQPQPPPPALSDNPYSTPLPTRTPRVSRTAGGSPVIPSPTGAATPAMTNFSNGSPAANNPQALTEEEQRILMEFQRQAGVTSPSLSPAPPTGSGTFQTPPQDGILPAFAVPQAGDISTQRFWRQYPTGR
jgi:hypothetical protein